MKHPTRLPAGILATVLVIAALLLLAVLGLLALWDADALLFARSVYLKNQRAHLESAFTLYQYAENFAEKQDEDGSLLLYDSLPDSRVYVTHKPWGLYEVVTAENHDHRLWSLRLMGAAEPWSTKCLFYYPDTNFSFTVTGKTNLKGEVLLPGTGIRYGQFESRFFEGERTPQKLIGQSRKTLPEPLPAAREAVTGLFALRDSLSGEPLDTDSIARPFRDNTPRLLQTGSGTLTGCTLTGNLVLLADDVHFDPSCRIDGILVVARSATFADGFSGTLQLFATDTVWVGRNVDLKHPSGIFLQQTEEKHRITLCENARVEGYVIVDGTAEEVPSRPTTTNYRQAPTARVRGLLYVNGVAQLQGIVSGAAFLQKALYSSSFGRYTDLIHNTTVLDNRVTAYPHWLETTHEKREAKWVY